MLITSELSAETSDSKQERVLTLQSGMLYDIAERVFFYQKEWHRGSLTFISYEMEVFIFYGGTCMKKLEIFDSTLRDGTQAAGIVFSNEDKINIIKALDRFGIDFIEAGNPASNPKDATLFHTVSSMALINSKLVAFGSTRHKDTKACEDVNLCALAESETEYVTVFGKCWDMHVTEIIRTSLEQNLEMIRDSISFLTQKGKHVFFDAEHFFDGFKRNREYAIDAVKAAQGAGAERIILCDTNGGCFPDEILQIVEYTAKEVNVPLGIHCHNDTDCATANTIAAVKAGAIQLQGTILGFGERCGNLNLLSAIAGLQLKLGYDCVPQKSLHEMTGLALYIAEISNLSLPDFMPYVGKNAFVHKGGMHADGVAKNAASFEHIEPSSVGNSRNFVISEVSGRSAMLSKINGYVPSLTRDSIEMQQIAALLKQQEYKGYQYEAAEASFELLVRNYMGTLHNYFDIVYFKIIGERQDDRQSPSSAIVKIKVGDKTEIAADEGMGPVNAIDKALRQALSFFYKEIGEVHLIDYKVRVVDSNSATAASVRVLIESTDGRDIWTTVGVSTDIINASVTALVDSVKYKLMKDNISLAK